MKTKGLSKEVTQAAKVIPLQGQSAMGLHPGKEGFWRAVGGAGGCAHLLKILPLGNKHTHVCRNLGKQREVMEVKQTDSLETIPISSDKLLPFAPPKHYLCFFLVQSPKTVCKTMSQSKNFSSDLGHPLPDTWQTLPDAHFKGCHFQSSEPCSGETGAVPFKLSWYFLPSQFYRRARKPKTLRNVQVTARIKVANPSHLSLESICHIKPVSLPPCQSLLPGRP